MNLRDLTHPTHGPAFAAKIAATAPLLDMTNAALAEIYRSFAQRQERLDPAAEAAIFSDLDSLYETGDDQ